MLLAQPEEECRQSLNQKFDLSMPGPIFARKRTSIQVSVSVLPLVKA